MADGVEIWMPLFIGDYLAETQRLTTEQHGAYLLLLMDLWRSGPLPNDAKVLQAITKLDPEGWARCKAGLIPLFELRGQNLHHSRLEKEKEKAVNNRAAASSRGKKAAHARWHGKDAAEEERSADHIADAWSNAASNASAQVEHTHKQCPSPSTSAPSLPSTRTSSGGGLRRKRVEPVGHLTEHIVDQIRDDGRLI